MDQVSNLNSPEEMAEEIDTEIRSLEVQNTPNTRSIRRRYSRSLKESSPDFVLNLARALLKNYGYRWLAYELIANHRATFQELGEVEVEEFGQGINGWKSVDGIGRILSGPAWLNGQISDELIHRWARSSDLWWRRAELVSTVALNMRSQGGLGDTDRTLAVCTKLVEDHEDMVVKAMSWALRELVVHDPDAVEAFVMGYDEVLAARVKREVRNKLATGLKNPKASNS